jgi:hypothetical protein
MPINHAKDQTLWKRRLEEALVELDPQTFPEKLNAAEKAVRMRRVELEFDANSDSRERSELSDALHTIYALGFLKSARE